MADNNLKPDKDLDIPGTPKVAGDYPGEEQGYTEGESIAFGMSGLLEGVAYPASKEDIIDYAIDVGVGPEIIGMLEQLPDTTYNTPSDVSQALEENANIIT